MKRTKTLFWAGILCLLGPLLQAQPYYFQHTYGTNVTNTSNQDFGYDGHRRQNNSEGYMISGAKRGLPTDLEIALAVTDDNGDVGIPGTFENYYKALNGSGTKVRVPYSYCGEILDNEFAVAGVCGSIVGWAQYIYYAEIDASGAVVNSMTYRTSADYGGYFLRELVTEPTGQYVYLMGEVTQISTSLDLIWVMKLKYDGTIQWAQVYDIEPSTDNWDFAYDGVELPGAAEFALVGSTKSAIDEYCGYIFVLDATTGLPSIPRITLLEDPGNNFFATCIDWSDEDNLLPSKGGYIVGGWSGLGPYEPTAFAVDYNFAAPWFMANTYTTGASNGTSFGLDIVYRYSPSGVDEYFMVGTTSAGYFGGTDAEVWRLDNSVTAIAQYAFGDTGDDNGRAIELDNGADGMAIFGTTDAVNGLPDMLIMNAYLSGHLPTGCNWQTNTPTSTFNHSIDQISSPSPYAVIHDADGSIVLDVAISDAPICSAPDVAGGDNTKMQLPILVAQDAIQLIGNQQDGYTLQVDHAGDKSLDLKVSLCDMTGRELHSQRFLLSQGNNKLELTDLSKTVSAGIYLYRWSSAQHNGAQKIILE